MPPRRARKQAAKVDEFEDANSALIAKLLAEDESAGYDDNYGGLGGGAGKFYSSVYDMMGSGGAGGAVDETGGNESADDDDYKPQKNGKKRGRPPGKSNKTAAKKVAESNENDEENDDGDDNKSGKKRAARKDVGKQRKPLRKWDDREEKLFVEALELYGRDWDKCASHVETRDKNAFKSHAQKYFIKLYRDGLELPPKVKESGEGYTLSGKPLDPESSSAKIYLEKGSRKSKDSTASADDKQQNNGTTNDDAVDGENAAQNSNKNGKKKVAKQTTKSPKKRKVAQDSDDEVPAIFIERKSEYSLRTRNKAKSKTFAEHEASQALSIIRCSNYTEENKQPITIHVEREALLLMDFHSHFTTSEIIGLLAGRFDAENNILSIERAYPCRSVLSEEEQHEMNVEMDPASEVRVRSEVAENNMSVVGWYHSHPVFEPEPSLRDIQNQINYQTLFQHTVMQTEYPGKDFVPFIGVIVGPYDVRMPTEQSVFNWFMAKTTGDTEEDMSDDIKHIPMRLKVHVKDTHIGSAADKDKERNEKISAYLESELVRLCEEYKDFHNLVNWGEIWRAKHPGKSNKVTQNYNTYHQHEVHTSNTSEGKNTDDEPGINISRLEKLKNSLGARLGASFSESEKQNFLEKISKILTESFPQTTKKE